jgi:hypothetical protein
MSDDCFPGPRADATPREGDGETPLVGAGVVAIFLLLGVILLAGGVI